MQKSKLKLKTTNYFFLRVITLLPSIPFNSSHSSISAATFGGGTNFKSLNNASQ